MYNVQLICKSLISKVSSSSVFSEKVALSLLERVVWVKITLYVPFFHGLDAKDFLLIMKIQWLRKFSFLKEMFGIALGNELIQRIRAIEINVYWKTWSHSFVWKHFPKVQWPPQFNVCCWKGLVLKVCIPFKCWSDIIYHFTLLKQALNICCQVGALKQPSVLQEMH